MFDETRSIDRIFDSPQAQHSVAGNAYILAIGIDRYQHVNPLDNAVRDVDKVVELLTTCYQFEPRYVTRLLNEGAKRSDIHREFKRLAQKITPGDTVLIYYSGHGIEDDNDGYWIPVDGVWGDTATFVSNIEILNFLKKINSFHTLIISDSCFSGTLFTDAERRATVRQRLEAIPSRWAMTSGRKEPVSDGRPGQNSPFADSLLLHLSRNNQPALPLTHLFDTVIEDVGSNAAQTPRCEPLRDVGHRGGEFMFRWNGRQVAYPHQSAPAYVRPPAPAWRTYLLVGFCSVLGLVVGFLAYRFLNPDVPLVKKAVLVPDRSFINLGSVRKDSIFEFRLENRGARAAKIDSITSTCPGHLRVLENMPISIPQNDSRTLKAKYEKPAQGSMSCTLTVNGAALEASVQVRIIAQVEAKATIKTVTRPERVREENSSHKKTKETVGLQVNVQVLHSAGEPIDSAFVIYRDQRTGRNVTAITSSDGSARLVVYQDAGTSFDFKIQKPGYKEILFKKVLSRDNNAFNVQLERRTFFNNPNSQSRRD